MQFNSPYSPFFTSGLLSPAAPSSRRGSLPTSPTSPSVQCDFDEASVFYFTLQPGRDSRQLRSFLSLDLADSTSSRRDRRPTTPLSPKPAPSIGLPPIPGSSTRSKLKLTIHPHHLSHSSPTLPFTAPPSHPQPSAPHSQPQSQPHPRPPPRRRRRSSADPPSRMSPSVRAPPPAPLHLRERGLSNASNADRRVSMSTVSTGYRRARRSAALAALEGRARPRDSGSRSAGGSAFTGPRYGQSAGSSEVVRYPFVAELARGVEGTMVKRNFMSMSDDEEDEDEGFQDGLESNDEDEEDEEDSDDDDITVRLTPAANADTDADTHALQRQFATYTLSPTPTPRSIPALSFTPSSAAPSPLHTPLLTPALLPSSLPSSAALWQTPRQHAPSYGYSFAAKESESFIDLGELDGECRGRGHGSRGAAENPKTLRTSTRTRIQARAPTPPLLSLPIGRI
ncbi:hypothetical protein HGRIS_011409 [Hohenbuehelia grisea]|uniref:Uncharacterized protein n=1 Tax=Hohenbuehelia grisea TaxID=104357 RepID=A0ABR3JV43_9AGAR